MTRLRVLIAAPGLPAVAQLAREVAAAPDLQLVGQATDLSGCYVLAERHEPDIALVGPELARSPDFEGLVSMFRVMGTAWLPLNPPGAPPAPAGTPVRGVAPGLPTAALVGLLRAARAEMPGPQRPVPPVPGKGGAGAAAAGPALRFHPDRLILIGASTGGIDALLQVLGAFPADCPPTAIVQHTGQSFSDSLIRLFARCSAARVVPAAPGLALTPGTIIVGAGCPGHLQLRPGRPLRADLVPGPAISGHVPSVDALFRSALPFAPSVVAALLTGMGRDGAQGLLDLRRAGARTVAQDQATSVVYGMPRAAADLGAAEAVLPLPRIAEHLLACATQRPAEAAAR